MKISINETADEEFAWAIAAVLSEHLGKPLELVVDGKAIAAHGGDDPDREDIEEILSGGPDRGHEKIADLGKLFIRDRLERIFNTIQYQDGTFAGFDDELPADGMVTAVGTIHGRPVFVTANDYTVKAGSLGQIGVEKEIRIAERAAKAGRPILRSIDSTGATEPLGAGAG